MSIMRTFATVAFIVGALSISQSSYAQTTTNAEKPCGCAWRDAATGQAVASGPLQTVSPVVGQRYYRGVLPSAADPNTAFDPETGRNFVLDASCVWRDAATGQAVASGPLQTVSPVVGQPYYRGVLPSAADPNTAFDPETGRNFVSVPCPPPTQTTKPSPTTTVTTPEENKKVALQIRGFGGTRFVNGNTPCATGFDGAVLFPLGNRVLVGPTGGFEWICSSLVQTIGGGPPPSTFINQSVGFKSGNFGGSIAFPFGGWQLGVHGGATVAGSTITQNGGVCLTSGCTISSTTTHDTVVGPFVGGYISHSIFSHVGVFVEYDYRRLKDIKSSVSVFDLHDSDLVGGLVLSFGRHKVK